MTSEGVTINVIDDPNQITVNVENEGSIIIDVFGGEKGDIGETGATGPQGPQGAIYRPTTEPEITIGFPNILPIDLNSSNQAIFEPNLDSLNRTINVDHRIDLSNDENCDLFSIFYRLTGTRIIEFGSNVKVSIASSIGTWLAPNLTLNCGIDDNILFVFMKNKIEGFYDLSVNEISL